MPGALPGMPGGPPQAPANDNKTLFLALGVILVIAIAVVAFFATQQS
jgi:hypothetical protein